MATTAFVHAVAIVHCLLAGSMTSISTRDHRRGTGGTSRCAETTYPFSFTDAILTKVGNGAFYQQELKRIYFLRDHGVLAPKIELSGRKIELLTDNRTDNYRQRITYSVSGESATVVDLADARASFRDAVADDDRVGRGAVSPILPTNATETTEFYIDGYMVLSYSHPAWRDALLQAFTTIWKRVLGMIDSDILNITLLGEAPVLGTGPGPLHLSRLPDPNFPVVDVAYRLMGHSKKPVDSDRVTFTFNGALLHTPINGTTVFFLSPDIIMVRELDAVKQSNLTFAPCNLQIYRDYIECLDPDVAALYRRPAAKKPITERK